MRKPWAALLAIASLGLLLRLFILSQRGSFWFDEAFSVHFASMPLSQMLHYLQFENNPPLYFIFLHFWIKLFGEGELAVRIPSMIFSLVSIPLLYILGKRLHSSAAGLFASFLTAISTFQVFYSTETRMYAMYLFFTLAAMILFLNMTRLGLRSDGGRASIYQSVAFFFVLLILVWIHITAWFIVLAMLAYLLWKEKFNPKQFYILHFKFLIITALLVLQFLPWAVNFIKLKIAAPLSQGFFFYIPPDKNFFPHILEVFIVFGQSNAFIVTILSAVMIGLLWFALDIRRSNLRTYGDWISPSIKFLLCWLFVPLLVGFAFSNAIPRYFIAVAPALYLLLGIGFANFWSKIKTHLTNRQCYMLHVACYMFLFALVLPDYPSLYKLWPPLWDKLAGWVEKRENVECRMENEECLIIINPHSEVLPFERYYRGDLPVVGFYPKDDDLDRDMRIVRTNWLSLNSNENVSRLADLTADYDRVFLVTGGIDPIGRNLVPAWFWENGWRRVSSQEFGRLWVMELEKQD